MRSLKWTAACFRISARLRLPHLLKGCFHSVVFHRGSIESMLQFNVLLTHNRHLSSESGVSLDVWAQNGLYGTGLAPTPVFTLIQAQIRAVTNAFLSEFYGLVLFIQIDPVTSDARVEEMRLRVGEYEGSPYPAFLQRAPNFIHRNLSGSRPVRHKCRLLWSETSSVEIMDPEAGARRALSFLVKDCHRLVVPLQRTSKEFIQAGVAQTALSRLLSCRLMNRAALSSRGRGGKGGRGPGGLLMKQRAAMLASIEWENGDRKDRHGRLWCVKVFSSGHEGQGDKKVAFSWLVNFRILVWLNHLFWWMCIPLTKWLKLIPI